MGFSDMDFPVFSHILHNIYSLTFTALQCSEIGAGSKRFVFRSARHRTKPPLSPNDQIFLS